MSQKSTIFIKAAGKINLFLDILGKRPDGYHNLKSILVPVNLYDDIEIRYSDNKISVEVEYEFEHLDKISYIKEKDNIVYKVAVALKQLTDCSGGVLIKIRKRIPLAAGLGGGSADAAAVLHGLNDFWNLNLSLENLMDIGSKFGSDIPAMVMGGAVLMEGRGEICTNLELNSNIKKWQIVLFNPGIEVSTGDIYKRYNSLLTKDKKLYYNTISFLQQGRVVDVDKLLFNELQETVFAKYPLINMLVNTIYDKNPAGCLLSGSGATVFAVVKDKEKAEELIEYVTSRMECPLWFRTVNLLPDSVMVAHGPLTA
jgi:4-diphosphocytidyl-2-C-methyl-D-erythritol kinase